MLFSPLFSSVSSPSFFLTSGANQQKATDAKCESNPSPPLPFVTPPAIFSLWHRSHYLWDLVKEMLHVFVRHWVCFLSWLLCLKVVELRAERGWWCRAGGESPQLTTWKKTCEGSHSHVVTGQFFLYNFYEKIWCFMRLQFPYISNMDIG